MPAKPSNPTRAASVVPRHGGPGSAGQPQDLSDPPASEARRAPGSSLVATAWLSWDHRTNGPVLVVRPEP